MNYVTIRGWFATWAICASVFVGLLALAQAARASSTLSMDSAETRIEMDSNTPEANHIISSINTVGSTVTVTITDTSSSILVGSDVADICTSTGSTATCTYSTASEERYDVYYYLGLGNDSASVSNNRDISPGQLVEGESGNDSLLGTSGRPFLIGGDGNDTAILMDGGLIDGEAGADTIIGDSGSADVTVLDGGQGSDSVTAKGGTNYVDVSSDPSALASDRVDCDSDSGYDAVDADKNNALGLFILDDFAFGDCENVYWHYA